MKLEHQVKNYLIWTWFQIARKYLTQSKNIETILRLISA